MPVFVAADDQDDTILSSFRWAFIYQKNNGDAEVLDLSKKVILFCGDRLKIFIEPIKNVFIYIYLYDSQNQLYVLFPESFKDFDKNYRSGESYFVPGGEDWFILDDTVGVETFYLLASDKRLTDLEKITMNYLNASKKKREMLKANVLSEIKADKRSFSQFKTVAEKPVPIAGSVRGIDDNIEQYAYQVETQTFYGKTIRLEHK